MILERPERVLAEAEEAVALLPWVQMAAAEEAECVQHNHRSKTPQRQRLFLIYLRASQPPVAVSAFSIKRIEEDGFSVPLR